MALHAEPATRLERRLSGVDRLRRGRANEDVDEADASGSSEERLSRATMSLVLADEVEERDLVLLSTLSLANTFSSLRYGSGRGLNMSSPEKRDREGETMLSVDVTDAPLDRRDVGLRSELVLNRCLSAFVL
jgi:hypothetical protein